MKISTPTSAKHLADNSALAYCTKTGINFALLTPSIPNLILEYDSPFARLSNAIKIIEQGSKELEKLDVEILAGLCLSVYSSFNLFEVHQPSYISNALLRTAGKQHLIWALNLSKAFSPSLVKRLPSFSIDYTTHKEGNSLEYSLGQYIKILRDTIYPPKLTSLAYEPDEDTVSELQELNLKGGKLIKKVSAINKLKDNAELDKHAIRYFTAQAINSLDTLEDTLLSNGLDKLVKFLNTILVGDSLYKLNYEHRNKVLDRLNSIEFLIEDEEILDTLNYLIEIVTKCAKPSLAKAALDNAFETALAPVERRQTLQEILAAKIAIAKGE